MKKLRIKQIIKCFLYTLLCVVMVGCSEPTPKKYYDSLGELLEDRPKPLIVVSKAVRDGNYIGDYKVITTFKDGNGGFVDCYGRNAYSLSVGEKIK